MYGYEVTASVTIPQGTADTKADEAIGETFGDAFTDFEADTKASVTDDSGNNIWKVQWQKGDALGGWSTGDQTAFNEFSMHSFTDANGKIATFKGISGGTALRLVYPYNPASAQISSSEYAVDMSNIVCDMTVPCDGLSQKNYMVSNLVASAENEWGNIRMYNTMAALKIKLKFSGLPAGTRKLLRVELSGNGTTKIYKNASIDLDAVSIDNILTSKTEGTISVSAENSPALVNNGIYELNTLMIPTTIMAESDNKLTVKVYMTGGYKSFDITVDSDVLLARNTYKTLRVTCDMSSYTTSADWAGSGSEADPYLLGSKADLTSLVADINSGDAQNGIYFKVVNDIDLACTEDSQWSPIGNSITRFQGIFDGNGHKITGLYINKTGYSSLGLFGYIQGRGTIKNLTVEGTVIGDGKVAGLCAYNSGGSIINCVNACAVKGSLNHVAGICGFNTSYDSKDGSIINCSNIGSVRSSGQYVGGICGYSSLGIITGCYNGGQVYGTNNPVGGVCGYAYDCPINDCYNTGTVEGTNSKVGGVCGAVDTDGDITNCYNAGSVIGPTDNSYNNVGGVCGECKNATIANSYNTGSIITATASNVGGICGYLSSSGAGNIINCYNSGVIQGPYYVGAVCGSKNSGSVTDCYYLGSCAKDGSGTDQTGVGVASGAAPAEDAAGSTTPKTATELKVLTGTLNTNGATYNDGSPTYNACAWLTTGTSPALAFGQVPMAAATGYDENWAAYASPNFGGGAGTQSNPYVITSPEELAHLAVLVNGGANQSGNYFTLTFDIDLSGKEWTAIGTGTNGQQFAGTFDGNGHKITGLYINKTGSGTTDKYQGLFGWIIDRATIKNFSVEGSVSGNGYIGGVCGVNYGTVINCSFTGSVKGIIIGGESRVGAGGVCGGNSGSIINCHNAGAITGSYQGIGGVSGSNDSGIITNCYNTGTVTGTSSCVGGVSGSNVYSSTIANCYNTGTVSGTSSVGGVCGFNRATIPITNCYNTGAVSGTGTVGGVCGDNNYGTIYNCYYLTGCAKIGSTVQKGIGGIDNDDPSNAVTLKLADATMKSTSIDIKDDTGYVPVADPDTYAYKDDTFSEALISRAVTYNSTTPDIKACTWTQVNGSYPTLVFGTDAQ